MNSNDISKKGYRTAFGATALFGGVQVFTIIIQILKSKVVALWLGVTGFGILSLFNAATSLIFTISNLGLQSSAVRDIANAQANQDISLVSKIAKAINRWVVVTGMFGALITIVLSPWLSKWLFESNEYTISFILLSVVVLMTCIYNGNYALLQGTRNLKFMAKANIFGALAGFLISLPFFYFLREEGIVWALILTAISTTVVSFYFSKKVKLIKINQTCKESYKLGLKTVKLGIMMSLSSISVLIVQFITKTFIVNNGGIEDVGLFQAGWALNASYLGLVFTAMGKDYFPRLSQISSDNERIKLSVNQQAEIAILILAPLIIIMIVFMPFFIEILYSSDFLPIVQMATCLLIGSIIKAGSWGISFVFLAKSEGKLYLFNELGIRCITLPAYLLFYNWYGLVGIGYTFILIYIIYFVWVSIVAYLRYRVFYERKFWKLFVLMFLLLVSFPIGQLMYNVKLIPGLILIIIVSCYSFFELNKRIKLKEYIKKNINGRK